MELSISQERFEELVREEIARRIGPLEPQISEALRRHFSLLTEERAIAFLGIEGQEPRRTFRRLAKRYGIPYVPIGFAIRYRLSDLEQFIAAHTVNPPAPRKPKDLTFPRDGSESRSCFASPPLQKEESAA